MGGSFACPECGNELQLKGTSAGRQVRCGWCETWVEVPFLPRASSRARRSRGRRPAWVPWAWAALGVLGILVAVFGSGRLMQSRARARQERSLAALVDEAKAEEAAGRPDKALVAIVGAIKEAGKLDPPRPDRVAELKGRRGELARKSAEAQLKAAATAGPAAAIATYRSLLSRVWRDPALVGLEAPIRERLEQTRRDWAESDLAAARRAVAEGRPNEAIDLCERLVVTSEELPPEVHERLKGEANAMVTSLVERRGVVFLPIQGQFTLGTSQSYNESFDPVFDRAFRDHGYAPRRPASAWLSVWDSRAPYRVTMDVVERLQGSYSSSNNRITILSARLNLLRGDVSVWQLGPLAAQTQPSIPSLAAFTAARLGPDDPRSPSFERLLYDDARETLRDRIKARLPTVPDYRPTPG